MRIAGLALAIFGLCSSTQAPAFEVASIKPSTSGGIVGGSCHGVDSKYGAATLGSAPPLGHCVYARASLKTLIRFAYLTSPDDIPNVVGGDSWTGTEEFSVDGKTEDPEHTKEEQLRLMLAALLRDRFKLQFHHESHEEQGYALLQDQNRSKLKESSNEPPVPAAINQAPTGGLVILPDGSGRIMRAKAIRTAALARFVSSALGRVVEDHTGLLGVYDATLSWTPTSVDALRAASPDPADDPGGPTLITALREQLGLRLQPQRVIVETFVIDHAERPTPN